MADFFVILGELRRRLNVTDCGGDPVPCLLRYSMVGNLPKCVFVGDKKPPVGPCTRDMAAFFSVLLSAVLFGRFLSLYWGAPAASKGNGLWRRPSAVSAQVLDSWKNPPLFFSFQAVISFTEACSQQQARTGRVARICHLHYSPLLRGEEMKKCWIMSRVTLHLSFTS